MDYKKCAEGILKGVGGKGNIISAAHCATRLRLVIADNSKMDTKAVENVDGVKGVFEASGQIQIIIGTGTVNKVYAEFIQLAGVSEATKDDVKQAAASKQNFFFRAIKTLGDVFVPIIPAIVASGLLNGLLGGLSNAIDGMADSSWYELLNIFSSAALAMLPILIAISAAKKFGGNPYLAAVIGYIMINPALVNAWTVWNYEGTIPTWNIFGIEIQKIGYQGHVIPVIISILFMSALEKWLHKIVPEVIDLFVTPLVTVLVTGLLTLLVIGPVFKVVEDYIVTGAKWLIAL
ncbi:MAG TPA: PTS beta-glucoside transporter subunit EIIBCA, partial [Lachnospiraceae bacterium]|nr:PTS beta-glucoside transporter subunit EIIBCA [Lachnospiraceae bacterium]